MTKLTDPTKSILYWTANPITFRKGKKKVKFIIECRVYMKEEDMKKDLGAQNASAYCQLYSHENPITIITIFHYKKISQKLIVHELIHMSQLIEYQLKISMPTLKMSDRWRERIAELGEKIYDQILFYNPKINGLFLHIYYK